MSPVLVVDVATVEAMRALGARLAELARPGDLVIADGPLGAGKTALAQGIGAGLGLPDGTVRSPTYTIADRHDAGRIPFVHVDAWRLGSAGELLDLDLDTDDALTYVEWGMDRAEGLADEVLVVRIDRRDGDAAGDADGVADGVADGDETRQVSLLPTGPGWEGRLAGWMV